jgi:hypothetical protein
LKKNLNIMKIKKQRLEKKQGFIDYHYSVNEKYPNGILLFLGSYVKKEERGKGIFKEMVKELFSMFPKGTEIQVALSNKNLVHFFKSLNFVNTDKIEYWGSPENATTLKNIL